jgi:hypothetical protein
MAVKDVVERIFSIPTDRRAILMSAIQGDLPIRHYEAVANVIHPRAQSDANAPASFWQEQMWVLEKSRCDTVCYNVPFYFDIVGQLNIGAFVNALQQILTRHSVLRSTIGMINDEIVQVVRQRPGAEQIEVSDLTDALDPLLRALELACCVARTQFSLEDGPLSKMVILRLSKDGAHHGLIWVASHAVADGWSLGIFVRELQRLYLADIQAHREGWPALAIQYSDYAKWQRRSLTTSRADKLVTFWTSELSGFTNLSFADQFKGAGAYDGGHEEFCLVHVERIQELALEWGVTLFVVLLSVYAILVGYFAEQDDVVIGTATNGRTLPEFEDIIGAFQSSLPIRIRLSPNLSVRDLVGRVNLTVQEALSHQELSFSRIVQELRIPRNAGVHPVWQTFFLVGSLPLVELAPALSEHVRMRIQGIRTNSVKFLFEMYADQRPDGWFGRFDYSRQLFTVDLAADFCRAFQSLITSVALAPDLSVESGMQILQAYIPRATSTRATFATNLQPGGSTSLDVHDEQGKVETTLRDLWVGILKVSQVSDEDDFFYQGGYSLLALRLIKSIKRRLGAELSVEEFFEHSSFGSLKRIICERL